MQDHEDASQANDRVAAHAAPTIDLLRRAHRGDAAAVDVLCARYLPRMQRWASGLLPGTARDAIDTSDIVQEALVRVFRGIEKVEARHEASLQAYTRQAILNRVRDQIRASRRRPEAVELEEVRADSGPSPLESVIGRELMDSYEKALTHLRDEEREAVLMRVELDCSYKEIAEALGKPSTDAARMMVARALVRLAEEMSNGE